MWDCKTSKMSQSPRAALNAFGLFAAGLSKSRATHLPRVAAANISAPFATSLQRDLRNLFTAFEAQKVAFGLVIATIIFFAAFKVIATLIMIATGSGVRHSG